MNFIVTNRPSYFSKINKDYNCIKLQDVETLPRNIGFDTETTSLQPRNGDVFSVQVGTGENNYIFDVDPIQKGKRIQFEDVVPLITDRRLVGHNLTFDLGWCYKHGFYPKEVHDTFIASKLLYNGYPNYFLHGFGHVMERELGLQYDKSEQKNIHKVRLSTESAIQYSFNDVDRILELIRVLGTKLKDNDMMEVYRLHMRYIRALAYMEQCGLPLNYEAWENKMKDDLVEQSTQSRNVIEYIYEHLPQFRDGQLDLFDDSNKILPNLASPKQMIPVFKAFGINTVSDDDPTKDSIEESVIKKTEHPFVDVWLEYQSINHDVTTYGKNILDRIENDRIYTTFNPILDTGRISTRREGINILNFPANKKTRQCVQAQPGYVMIVSDYQGQENVVGVDYHEDPMMLKSIQEGADLHSAMVRTIHPELADAPDSVIMTEHKDKRNRYKSVRFAASYGGTGYTIANNMNIPIEKGEEYYKAYRELHSGIYEWIGPFLKKCTEQGYIESYLGFRLYLPYYDEYKEVKKWYDTLSKTFWTDYKEGKELYKTLQEAKQTPTEEEKFIIAPYIMNKSKVSKYFKLIGQYTRLCLNNPVQASSAMVTKAAVSKLFEYIEDRGHIGKVKIVNVPHDEIVLEVLEELAEEYKEVLQNTMMEEGNKLLRLDSIRFEAEANIGSNWYEAK